MPLQIANLACAAVLAAIEDVIYLNVYVPQASTALTIWRWTACLALHIGCTAVASRGLIDVWQRAMTERRRPRMVDCARMLIIAIVLHGLYNATAIAQELFNISF